MLRKRSSSSFCPTTTATTSAPSSIAREQHIHHQQPHWTFGWLARLCTIPHHHHHHHHHHHRRIHFGIVMVALLSVLFCLSLMFPLHLVALSSYYSVSSENHADVIIVGSGLAGLSAALTVLERGGRVVLLEKEATLGGNSKKASSGINGCCFADETIKSHDTLELFAADTTRSAGSAAQPALIATLTAHSAAAIKWLQDQLDVQLNIVAQLGGHSVARTHRPSEGMVGAELVARLSNALQKYISETGRLQLYTETRVTRLVQSTKTGHVTGVEAVINSIGNVSDIGSTDSTSGPKQHEHRFWRAPQVILATGGFAADRSPDSMLAAVRPELLTFGTTAGAFSTGDGLNLALTLNKEYNNENNDKRDSPTLTRPAMVDLEKIQLHPTGFVDPEVYQNGQMLAATGGNHILAAELLRGVGGILLNDKGRRFCNELGLRSEVTAAMLRHDADYSATGEWRAGTPPPVFSLVLSEAAVQQAQAHVGFYLHKGLMVKLKGIEALASHLQVPATALIETFREYREHAIKSEDSFGKISFNGMFAQDLASETFYVGLVTPVLHYCMGGLQIDSDGHVLDEDGILIPGLYAAGEVTGGVHGDNRLGGNSLLECVVFGRIVGNAISIRPIANLHGVRRATTPKRVDPADRLISGTELARHASPNSCWVVIRGWVYDLAAFAIKHAGGKDTIHMFCGKDATTTFSMLHTTQVLEQVELPIIGKFVEAGE